MNTLSLRAALIVIHVQPFHPSRRKVSPLPVMTWWSKCIFPFIRSNGTAGIWYSLQQHQDHLQVAGWILKYKKLSPCVVVALLAINSSRSSMVLFRRALNKAGWFRIRIKLMKLLNLPLNRRSLRRCFRKRVHCNIVIPKKFPLIFLKIRGISLEQSDIFMSITPKLSLCMSARCSWQGYLFDFAGKSNFQIHFTWQWFERILLMKCCSCDRSRLAEAFKERYGFRRSLTRKSALNGMSTEQCRQSRNYQFIFTVLSMIDIRPGQV